MTFFLTLFFYPNYQEEFTEQLFMDIFDCSHLFHIAITTWNSTPLHIQSCRPFLPCKWKLLSQRCIPPEILPLWDTEVSFFHFLHYFIYHEITTKTFGDCRFLAGVRTSEVPTWRLWHWRMQHSLLPNTSITSLQAAPPPLLHQHVPYHLATHRAPTLSRYLCRDTSILDFKQLKNNFH